MKRLLTVLAILMLLMLSTSAFAQDDVTLDFWFNGSDQLNQFNTTIIEAYQAENPNVTIVYQPYPNENYKTSIQVAIASDSPPDLFFNWNGDDTGRFVREGHLLDLTPYAEEFGWGETISAAATDAFTFDGSLYGAPFSTEAKYFYYNLAIFEEQGLEIPESFDDLLGICTSLRDAGIVPMAFGNQERWEGVHYMTIFNQKLVDQETMFSDYALASAEDDIFTDPNYVEAFQRLIDMRDAGCFADAVNSTTPSAALAQFFTEQTAMYYQGTWIISALRDNDFEGQYGLFRMPPMVDDMAMGNQNFVLMGPVSVQVSAKTEHPDVAADFLNFYLTAESQLTMVEITARNPVNSAAIDEDLMSAEQLFVVNDLATADGAVAWLDVVLENSVSEVYLNAIQEVYAGTLTPEDAVAAIREQALVAKAELGS